VIAEAHPEADALGIDVLGEGMQLVVAVQIDGALADDREGVVPPL